MPKIYKPKGNAREYSPYALNHIQGCNHGCAYCYVPPLKNRFNKDYKHNSIIIPNIDETLANIEKNKGLVEQVFLSFTSDPYSIGKDKAESQAILQATERVLRALFRNNIKVSILTKSDLVLVHSYLFLEYPHLCNIGMSLTFDNDYDSLTYEPFASLPVERIETLGKLHKAGIQTWASLEPVVFHSQSLNLLEQVTEITDFVKIGAINRWKDRPKEKTTWQDFLIETIGILNHNNHPAYIKKSLRDKAPNVVVPTEMMDMNKFNL